MTFIALILVVIFHTFIVAALCVATAVLLFAEPWYVSAPLVTYLLGAAFGKCPLTAIENRLRRQLGVREIDGFIEHYLWRKGR